MPKSKYGEKVLKSAKEKVEVKRRLQKKYPQMYEKDWGKKKPNWAQRLKGKVQEYIKSTSRTRATESGLKKAGVGKKKVKKLRDKY
jgi:hypothetical protein